MGLHWQLAGLLGCAGLLACDLPEDETKFEVAGATLSAAGGFVVSTDDVFTVVFPPRSLLEPTLVTVRPVEHINASMGRAYSVIGPLQLGEPLVVEYRYALSEVGGANLETLRIARLTRGRWELLETELNERAQTLSAADLQVGLPYAIVDIGGSSGVDPNTPGVTRDSG